MLRSEASDMSKWDLALEIVIVALASGIMVALRYSGGWVSPGLLDFLGIVATCNPAISTSGIFVVVWLFRFGTSCIVASAVFCKGRRGRFVNYALVTSATVVINLLMGLGQMSVGE
jgi:hypothetical protein